MSTYEEPQDHEQRIIEALEAKRDSLEEVASTDTSFAPRAESALEWIDERTEDEDDA